MACWAVVSGIGCKNAELAARAVVAQYRPAILISAGAGGRADTQLKVGSVFTPMWWWMRPDGAEYRCTADDKPR